MQVIAVDAFRDSKVEELKMMIDDYTVSYGRKTEECNDCALKLLKEIADGG